MSKFTWQGVVVLLIVLAAAVALAKLQMGDLAKALITGAVGLLALVTPALKEGGDA